MTLTQNLRIAILQAAFQGELSEQKKEDGTGEDLHKKILEKKSQLGIKKKKNFDISLEDCFFEIPNSWKWVCIGEIFIHNTGKAQNSSGAKEGVIKKFLTTSNVYWNSFDFTTVKEMNFTEKELERCTVTKGDLLVCEGGDFGRAAIWNYDENICIQNHVHRLRPYIPMDAKFFYYLFYFYKNTGKLNGKGIGIKSLSTESMSLIKVPLPPIEEQKRITKKLDELLEKILEYEKVENKLNEINTKFPNDMRDSLLQAAIQGKLTEQLKSDSNINDFLIKAKNIKQEKTISKTINNKKTCKEVDEGLFDIPDNWEWVHLSDIVDFKMGKTPARIDHKSWGNDYKWFSIADMIPDSIVKETKEGITQYALDKSFSGKISPAGTLIMSFKLTVGRVCILGCDAVHNEAIISIFPFYDENETLKNYLFKILPYISQYGDTKGAIKGDTLNSTSLSELLIPLPPIEEQKRIVDKLDKLLPLCDSLI